ncbi:hypothetical protein ACSQ67_000871 [Phaseolus vulgaris]
MKRGSHFQGIVAFNAYADFETRQAISFVLSFNLNISHFRSLNFMLSGLLFQLPGKGRPVDFCNFQTSAISIFVHSLLFFGFMVIFLIAINVHIGSG